LPTSVEQSETLYLVDGHAQIFRAYHAIRGGMSSPVTGEPTHAVFGFAGMLFKLLSEYVPDYVVMAIDVPGETFRDQMYSQYKAHRDPPPDDFFPQEQRIFEMTRMFGIPVVGVAGVEADDVIATLTHRVLDDEASRQTEVRIISRDKDLHQLLGPRVTMLDIHKDETMDTGRLEAEKGIRPEQVVDVLALMGDAADNIPGVEGIGPKTAAKLISEYGSIEGILSNLDKIKGKRHDNIETARDRLSLNLKLVELKRDVDIDLDLEEVRPGKVDVPALRQFFQTLGFRRYVRDLDTLVKTAGSAPAEAQTFCENIFDVQEASRADVGASTPLISAGSGSYRAITTQPQLEELVAELRGQTLISVDTETIGLGRKAGLCGIALAWQADSGVYVPMVSPCPDEHLDGQAVLVALKPLLENPQLAKCGHNLKYDALVLRHVGVQLRGIAFDTMIASQLLGFVSASLDVIAETLLGHTMIPISALIGPKGDEQATMDQIDVEQITPYAAEDADMVLRLYHKLQPMILEKGMENLLAVEMPVVEALAEMEHNGIRVNPDELLEQKRKSNQRIDELRQQIFEAAGETFELNSPKQVGWMLFNNLGLPVIKKLKTGPSTDVEVLERLANREDLPPEKTQVPRLIVEYRRYTKLVNTYLDNLRHSVDEDDGRIHASYSQLGAATGRLSSSSPNLQNIPVRTDVGRQIRKAFVAEPDHVLICADYSQIELRILAHLSEDSALIEAFKNDVDIHTAVAAQVFDVEPDQVTGSQRDHAKMINFGIIYGITPYGLARRIRGLDVESAKKLIEDYRAHFPGIDKFLHHCVDYALEHGYVQTILGRRRQIPQINSHNAQSRSLGERLAINTVVQGSATGDLIKAAMVNLYHRIYDDGLPMRMLVQVHDELLIEAPADQAEAQAAIVRQVMESAMSLRVPLKVEVGIGPDWLGAK